MSELTPKQQYRQACHLRRKQSAMDAAAISLYEIASEHEGGNYFVHSTLVHAANTKANEAFEAWAMVYEMPMSIQKASLSVAIQRRASDRYEDGNWLVERNGWAYWRWEARQRMAIDEIPF